DVRIIAATNRDLSRLVDEGGFRRDLYARISLWEIAVPAISRRRADIAIWVDIFHARWLASRGLTANPLRFDAPAMEVLLRSRWREHLRGLDRLVHELASRPPQQDPLGPSDLPAWLYEVRAAQDLTVASAKLPSSREPAALTEPPEREPALKPDEAAKQ